MPAFVATPPSRRSRRRQRHAARRDDWSGRRRRSWRNSASAFGTRRRRQIRDDRTEFGVGDAFHRTHRALAAGDRRANRVLADSVRDVGQRWRGRPRRILLIRSVTRLTVLLVRLLAERAGSAGPRLDVFELQNRDLVDVDDEYETFFRIGRGRSPIRSTLITR